jgi:hypothetical protein
MLLDRRASSWIVTVMLDGVLKLTAQAAATPSSSNIEVDLGILDLGPPSTANDIVFDNVLVRTY